MNARATYRLQFRNGMTFARAETLAPYLARLRRQPSLRLADLCRRAQSTHGYDAIDMNLIEPPLGGEAGFQVSGRNVTSSWHRHRAGFRAQPHGSEPPLNAWWHDVLEWGAAAGHAQHFDVDWSAPKLIVPTLADPYGVALERGDFGLAFDGTPRKPSRSRRMISSYR